MTDKHTLVERLNEFVGEDGRIPIPIIDQHKNVVGTAYVSPEDMAHDEAFIDDDGEIWVPPTAWAYFAACRARNEKATRITALEAENAELAEALEQAAHFAAMLAMYDGSAPLADRFVSIPAIVARAAKACLPALDATLAKARQSDEGE